MICGRRGEGGGGIAERLAGPEDKWDDAGTCSFCGSISPDELFRAIDAGGELGPTDKNYKVYVEDENVSAGQPCCDGSIYIGDDDPRAEESRRGYTQVTSENIGTLPPSPDGRPHGHKVGDWVHIGKMPARRTRKFYFQHFDAAEKGRFVDLLNAKKIKIGYPGQFYRLPFFVQRDVAQHNSLK